MDGLKGDPELSRDAGAGVREDGELEMVLLRGGQRLVRRLRTDRGERQGRLLLAQVRRDPNQLQIALDAARSLLRTALT